MVDNNALRFNQASITALVVVGFVLGGAIGLALVAATALSLLAGAAVPRFGPFALIYRGVVLRLGLLKPDRVADDPAPHRFAQLMGGSVTAVAAILLAVGVGLIGWALAWLVVALALTNLVLGFCMGCFIFLQMARAGLIRRSVSAP